MEAHTLSVLLPLVLVSLNTINGAPLFRRQDVDSSTSGAPEDQSACTLDGNPDFYGLGIRVGIYLQWVTSLFVNHFLQAAIEGSLETNTIFLLALFAALATSTVSQTVQAAEIVVLLHLCFGFVSSILSIWGYRTTTPSHEAVRFPLLGSFARLTLTATICTYGLWFWFVGVDNTISDSCPTYTFLFGRLDVEGPVKHYFQASTIVFCIVYWFLFVKEFLMINFFFLFSLLKTAILGVVFVFLSPRSPLNDLGDGKLSMKARVLRSLVFVFRTWPRLATPIIWSRINGKESAGEKRPNTSFWLVGILNFWILLTRAWFQFLCILVFGHCPRVDIPPLIAPSIFENTGTGFVAQWRAKVLKMVTYVPGQPTRWSRP